MTDRARGERGHTTAARWFLLAAAAGGLHAAATLYWAAGGKALLWTLGASLIATFDAMHWVLYPLAAIKAFGALGPWWLSRHGWWPSRRLVRVAFWVGAVALLIWGGLNTIVGNLVLLGMVTPSGGVDRAAMIGHAWLWDPLFVVWGTGLVLGLLGSRRRKN